MNKNSLHTILGANGTIANELVPILRSHGHKIRLVSRNPKLTPGAESRKADVLNYKEVLKSIRGSEIVYLLVGIKYDHMAWEVEWPIIMQNVINACKTEGCKLIFFDNAYMYGKTKGKMTEATPYIPVSKKGQVRSQVAQMLLREMEAGSIEAAIARAVDFYGPAVTDKSAASMLVFGRMKKGKTAQWFINPDVPRSYTYTPDAAKAVYILATHEESFGQVWHLPTVQPALTGREFIKLAAKYMGASDKVQVLPKWLLKVLGWFNPLMREVSEMSYQDEFPFQFDSSKFEKAFQFSPTPYEEAVKKTAEWFLENNGVPDYQKARKRDADVA